MKRVLQLLIVSVFGLLLNLHAAERTAGAKVLLALPENVASANEFAKYVSAVEGFTREYFSGSVDVVRVALPSVEPSEVFRAASVRNIRWALSFSFEDDDCYYRAFDCVSKKILSYEKESTYQVALDRKGSIDIWTSKDLYALLYIHILEANRFFLGDVGGDSAAEKRFVVSSFISDDKSRAAFPDVSEQLARELSAQTKSLRTLTPAINRYPSDMYRFISSSEEIKQRALVWNARWYLAGSIFSEKGNYKLYLYLIDCFGGSSAIICDSELYSADDLNRLIADSVKKISLLVAGGGSSSDLENKRLSLIYEYTKSSQFPVYSMTAAPNGDMYLSTLMSVVKFSKTGTLQEETGMYGTGAGEYQGAWKLRTDAQNNVYLLDYITGKVQIYSSKGELKSEIRTGLAYPMNLAVSDDGTLFLCESAKNYLYCLAAPYLSPVKISITGIPSISGLFSFKNRVFAWGVISGSVINIYEVKRNGTVVPEVSISVPNFYSGQLACDAQGNYIALEQSSSYILKADKAGTVLWLNRTVNGLSGNFNMPMDLSCSSDGKILISDMMNKRGLVLAEVDGFTSLPDGQSYFARAKKNSSAGSAFYFADLQCAVKSGSIDAMITLAERYSSMNYFEPALALLEKAKALDSKRATIAKILEDVRFRSYVFNGDLLSERASHLLKIAGVESARQYYAEGVKNYEIAMNIRPNDKALQSRYADFKAMFGKASGESPLPQAEILEISTEPVFSALYKYYNENEMGSVTVRNSTGKTMESVFARIEVKGFMDYPTESRTYRGVSDGADQKIKLYAVFSNNILNITEDTPLSAQVSVIYKVDGKEYTVTKPISLSVYNRNALVWDNIGKLSSFVTPKDPVVSVFSRSILNRFRNTRFSFMNSNFLSAVQIFDSLGVYGITYVKDPKTPFAQFSKSRTQVDFIQYPRDTLRFKTGDCDDLTVLTSSLLENVGIETASITVPGHIFLMFNTGIPEANAGEISANENMIVKYNGTVWVPVETTLLGKSFLTAWDEAAKTYNRYKGSADLSINAVRDGWEKFAPVTLNETQWSPSLPDTDMSEKLYFEDINSLIERELSKKVSSLKEKIAHDPKSPSPYNALGILYARYGRYKESEENFKKAVALNPDFAQSYQNLGNIFLLQENYAQAEVYYRKASELAPGNANVFINLALLYEKMNRKKDLEIAYNRAVKINARLEKQYAYLVKSSDGSRAAAAEKPNLLWGE